MSDLTDLDTNRKAFVDRLKAAKGDESARALAKRTGVSISAMNQYLAGKNEPTRPVLIAIAVATSVSVDWLATGNGPMSAREDTALLPVANAPVRPNTSGIDEALMGRLIDGISKVYKELGQAIAPVNLGQLAARLHNDIIAVAETPEDFPGAVKMRLAQLRRELRVAADDPTKANRSA